MENSVVRDAVVNYEGLEAFVDKYLKYDHSAYMRGYVSRKYPGYVERYFGKYGFGIRIHTACYIMLCPIASARMLRNCTEY